MKKKMQRALSFFLTVIMLVSTMSVGFFGITAIAATDPTVSKTDNAIIAVPETVYMTPSTGASTTGQYYVNNILDASGNVKLEVSAANTNAYVQLYVPGAKDVSIAVNTITSGIGDIVLAEAGATSGSYENASLSHILDANGYMNYPTAGLYISGTGLNAGQTALAEWVFTVTMNDDSVRTYYAYSTLYAPYYQPVGAAAEAWSSSTRQSWAGSILWVEGVHNATASNYSGAAAWYPRTDNFIPMVGSYYSSGFNNRRPSGDWIQEGSNGLFASVTYLESNGSNHRRVNVVSPLAHLTVDTSRYTNFSQIPNFKVGYMVTDSESADEGSYYVADYTGYNYTGSEDGVDLGSYGNGGSERDRRAEYYEAPKGAVITQGDNKDCSEKYRGTWTRDVVSGSVFIKGALRTENNNYTIKKSAWNNNFVEINVTGANKNPLRQLVLKGTSLNKANYTADSWDDYQVALRTAAQNLGNPTSSSTDTSALQTAMDYLQTAVSFDANSGKFSGTPVTAVKIGGNTSVAYEPTFTATKKGYTFLGWSKDKTATTGETTLTVDLYDTNKKYYAIFQPDTHLLFDTILDMGKWDFTSTSGATASGNNGISLQNNNSSGEKTLNSNYFPVTAGKQYYINMDVTGDSWDVYIFFQTNNSVDYSSSAWLDFSDSTGRFSNSGGVTSRTFTAPAGAERAYIRLDSNTPGKTVTFNDIRIYEVGKVDEAVDFGDLASFKSLKGSSTYGSLPVPTKTNYDFVGWFTADNKQIKESDTVSITTNTTVYSKWTPTVYTVTFDSNGGNAVTAKTYSVENNNIKVPSTTRTGYTFSHWEVVSASGNWTQGATVNAGSTLAGKNGNVTLKAVWTNNKYNVNLNLNAPSVVVTPPECDKTSTEVTYDKQIGTLPVPTLTGYEFAGWYNAATDGTQVTASTVYTTAGSSTIYAHWNPVTYNMTVDTNGGSAVSGASFNVQNAVIPAASSMTGYAFGYWEVVATTGNWEIGATYAPGAVVSGKYGDVTLKAVWANNEYKLYFDVNTPAGAVTEAECDTAPIDVKYDNAVGTLPVASLEGYDFVGWFTADGTEITASTVYKTVDNTTVYAKWDVKDYTIIIDEDAGVAVPDGSYTIESGVIPDATTRTGYTFSHWEVKESVGNWVAGTVLNPGDSAVGKYGDVSIKAIWTANNYTVTFEGNPSEGTVSQPVLDKTSITVTYDSVLNIKETLPVATRTGYNFLGWYTEAEGGEKVTEANVYTVDGNSTYYAHWEIVNYTVTFVVENGEAIDSKKYTVEDELVLPDAVREGYEFSTWFNNQGAVGSWKKYGTYEGKLGTNNWGDVTLDAEFTAKEFVITWIINGKTETSLHKFGTKPSHADPVITDDPYTEYSFVEWSPAIAVVSGPATYTAVFDTEVKKYRLTWVDENGEEIHSGLIPYNTEFTTEIKNLITPPAKEGYDVEWDFGGYTHMPAENLVVKPVYTPHKFTITWKVDGNVIGTTEAAYDSMPVYPDTPKKAETKEYRYEFTGWDPALSVVKGDAEYKAVFKEIPQEYKVYWYDIDGNVIEEYTYTLAYGSPITNIPKVPEVANHVGSWNIPETMPAEDLHVYSNYVKGSLVTWYLDGTADGLTYQQGFENGDPIKYERSNPTKDDREYTYTFEGWASTPGGTVVIGVDNVGYPYATEEDFHYYAVYSKVAKEYTITWMAEGTEIRKDTVAFGKPVTDIPEILAKTGYNGVWVNVPATMPSDDIVIEAEYTPINYTITWIVNGNENKTTFAYDTMPEFTGATSKPSTATTDFTFTGWDKDITLVKGDTTYIAQYSESARMYTVTWKYENGNVIKSYSVANGEAITEIPVITEKEGHDAKYEVPDVMPTENITIVVTYEAKSYTITWSTPSGDIQETWKYGETPVYDTAKYGIPAKEATAEHQFTFRAWSPVVTTVKGDKTYVAEFSQTARRYTVVWYVDGEFYDTRDIAYGSIIPTLTVPDKTGFTGNWDNSYRIMPAKDITINAVYTPKKYTVYWKVDGLTVYSAAVSFGDSIPAQKVPDRLGHTGEWIDVPEKMPAQNITITAAYKPNVYNATWRVNNVDNYDTATYGVDYVITFTGESIPEDVRITVGGTILDVENYTYNLETGVLTINGAAILGDIYVTARALGGKLDVVINSTNASMSNQNTTVNERQAYHTQIIPEKGYLLPDFVEIYVDGRLVTDGYTYDSSTGKLTINAEIIIGVIELTFDCPPDPDYDPSAPEEDDAVKNCKCNCHSKNAFTKFFFDLATFLRKLFGMDQYRYCDCGAAHW